MSGAPVDSRWWLESEREPGKIVTSLVKRIGEDDRKRAHILQHAARMYGDDDDSEFGGSDGAVQWESDTLAWNGIKSICDTLQSEVVANRPRPMVLTGDGDWELQQRSEKMSKFAEGQFGECRIDHDISPSCALDALVFGTGIAHVFAEFGRLQVERVHASELFVDRLDGRERRPLALYRVKPMDRYLLKELYPKYADDILVATNSDMDWSHVTHLNTDKLLVTEAWRLPVGNMPGRHVIALDRLTLLDEEWESDSFPFPVLRWKERLRGYWGMGLAEELTGNQYALNSTLETIDLNHYLHGNLRIWVDVGSKVTTDHITNGVGDIVKYTGRPPSFDTPNPVNPALYQWAETLWHKQFEITGVSQMSAMGSKPAGLDSGKALRIYLDTGSKRFIRFQRDYEEFHVEIARQMFALMGRLANEDESYEVVYQGKDGIERIKWADVNLERDAYKVQVFPVSALSNSPEGRLSQLQEMYNSGDGVISKQMFVKLLNFPDLESDDYSTTAPLDLAEKIVFQMLSLGKSISPEPFFDLALHIKVAGACYQRAMVKGAKEGRLELLREYIESCQALLSPPSPAGAPPGAVPGMSPPGGLAPPPSDPSGADASAPMTPQPAT